MNTEEKNKTREESVKAEHIASTKPLLEVYLQSILSMLREHASNQEETYRAAELLALRAENTDMARLAARLRNIIGINLSFTKNVANDLEGTLTVLAELDGRELAKRIAIN